MHVYQAGIRHPDLFRFVAEHLVGPEHDPVPAGKLHCGRGLDEFSSQGIGNLVWSYARQAQLSENTKNKDNGRMGMYISISRDVGEQLMKRLCNCCAEHNLRKYGE